MSKIKSKIDKYLESYTIDWEIDIYNDDYGYYYDYYEDEYCTRPCCLVEYRKVKVYQTHLLYRSSIRSSLIGYSIDMDSIYEIGTQNYRDNILTKILDESLKITLKDYL